MASSEQLLLESIAFAQRAVEALKKSDPDRYAALTGLLALDGSVVRIVIDVLGAPVAMCFAVIDDVSYPVGVEFFSVARKTLN